jgi:alpha-tubulin suppressor-like RCC1 family protein
MANGVDSGTFLSPVQISGSYSGVLSVSVGHVFTCMVTNAGAVMCSGFNGNKQLGIEILTGYKLVMTASDAGSGVLISGITKVYCGFDYACALSAVNTYCWGNSFYGQIGASSGTFATLGLIATMLSLSDGHACGLFSGTVKCFGYNGNGQLARGTADGNANADPLNSLFEGAVTDIACGWLHTCVRLVNGEVQCVGGSNYSYFGELGVGFTGSISIVSVQGLPATVSPTSNQPTRNPVGRPTRSPTLMPTVPPTRVPSRIPTSAPNRKTSAGMVVSVNAFVCFLLFVFM